MVRAVVDKQWKIVKEAINLRNGLPFINCGTWKQETSLGMGYYQGHHRMQFVLQCLHTVALGTSQICYRC